MRRLHGRDFSAAFLIAALSSSSATAQGNDNPWGLRNILKSAQLPSWTIPEFQAEFGPHQAGHMAFWLYWSEVQPTATTILYEELDRGIQLVSSVGANPVIVFQAAPRPPSFGGFWATNNVEPFTGPKDLMTGAVPSWPTGLPKGFSPSLYDAATLVANRIAGTFSGTAYMRFHNEAWDLWSLGGADSWGSNLNNYILSYLTFRQALEDVENATANPNMQFEVGHGSIPRGRVVPFELYRIGLSNVEARPLIIQAINGLTERNQCVIGNVYGIDMPINTWPEVATYAGLEHPYNRKQDAWLASFVNWTAAGYFDFTTAHPHAKPRFIDLEQFFYDRAVTSAGGTPPRWIAAEAAFELLDQDNWGFIPCPGAALDQYVAEDYGRKWCTLAALDTIFCSPIVGGPHPKYIGLYQPDGTPSSSTGCGGGPGGCPTLPPPTNCVMNLCRFPSNDAFKFLCGEIGAPDSVIKVKANMNFVHYRFERDSVGKQVDTLWRRELLDGTAVPNDAAVVAPAGYSDAKVYDVLGNLEATHAGVNEIVISQLGAAPRVVVWE